MNKIVLNEKILRRDIYNAKKVYSHTFLACICLFVLFNSNNILFWILSTIAFWLNMGVINEYTFRSVKIDKGEYLILPSTVMNKKVKYMYGGSSITLDERNLPHFRDKEKILIVLIEGKALFAYSQEKYVLSKELLLKLK